MSVEVNEDKSAVYTIKLKEGMKFTDGEDVTIDDYIYGLYVRADASFTGPSALVNTGMVGVDEYFYDDPNYSEAIKGFEAEFEMYKIENITFETFKQWAIETEVAGSFDAEDLEGTIEYLESEFGGAYDEKLAALDKTNAEAVKEIYIQAEFDFFLESYDLFNEKMDEKKDSYAAGNLEDGIDVPEISGITRIDEYTCTIETEEFSVFDERTFTAHSGVGSLAPSHYYGEYEKGNVSSILSNLEPMGSGPYIWKGFKDNIGTCVANANYFRGVPATGTVRWQHVAQNLIIDALINADIDIVEPSMSKSNKEILDSAADKITYTMVENNGYGYMGTNRESLDLNVSKGVWSLMNRLPSVEGYYGVGLGLADVIERPLSTVVAEYPQDAKPYYEYSPEKALEYFNAAGYTQTSGKLVNDKGEQLVISAYIGGDGAGDHPAYAMLAQAGEDMAALGGELQINDVGFAILQSAMNDGTADLWTLAWLDVNTAETDTRFRSTGGQNRSRFYDSKMDQLLDKVKTTVDFDERKAAVAEMLDYAMENCLEYPLYQRKNAFAYNLSTVNMDTIPEASSFYNYQNELYKVKVK